MAASKHLKFVIRKAIGLGFRRRVLGLLMALLPNYFLNIVERSHAAHSFNRVLKLYKNHDSELFRKMVSFLQILIKGLPINMKNI